MGTNDGKLLWRKNLESVDLRRGSFGRVQLEVGRSSSGKMKWQGGSTGKCKGEYG